VIEISRERQEKDKKNLKENEHGNDEWQSIGYDKRRVEE